MTTERNKLRAKLKLANATNNSLRNQIRDLVAELDASNLEELDRLTTKNEVL